LRPTDPRELKRKKERTRREVGHARSAGRTNSVVLAPVLGAKQKARGATRLTSPVRSPQARLDEAVGLAAAIDLEVKASGLVPVPNPRPATLFGSGKVEELAGLVRAEEAVLVIVDHPLTPVQQRNLETAWDAKVLDRTGLIPRFSQARGRGESLKSSRPSRLSKSHIRSWTHLARAVASASSAAPARRRSRPTAG
jgi:GTP-binding protein HflX